MNFDKFEDKNLVGLIERLADYVIDCEKEREDYKTHLEDNELEPYMWHTSHVFGIANEVKEQLDSAYVLPGDFMADAELDVSDELKQALGDLLDWAQFMGGFECPVWKRAKEIYNESKR